MPFKHTTNNLYLALKDLSAYLTKNNVKHVVIGGLAVGQYTKNPRITMDIDLFTDNSVENFMPNLGPLANVDGIKSKWQDIDVELIYPYGTGEEADLIFRNVQFIDGIPVAGKNALLYLKLNAGRTKDTADVIELAKTTQPEERAKFKELLFNSKEKDLPKDVTELSEDFESLSNIADLEEAQNKKKAGAEYRKFLLRKFS